MNPDFFLEKVELPSRIFPEFVLVIETRNLTISKEKMLIIHEKLEIARNSTVFRSSVIYITRKINPLNLPPCNFVKKETLALTFSCEFCEIFKSTFFIKHIRTTAPGYHFKQNWNLYVPNFKTESGTSISSKNNYASKHQRTFYYNKTNARILLFFRIALLSRVYPHFILNILKI